MYAVGHAGGRDEEEVGVGFFFFVYKGYGIYYFGGYGIFNVVLLKIINLCLPTSNPLPKILFLKIFLKFFFSKTSLERGLRGIKKLATRR